MPGGPKEACALMFGNAALSTTKLWSMPTPQIKAFCLWKESASKKLSSMFGGCQCRAQSSSGPRKEKRGPSVTCSPCTL